MKSLASAALVLTTLVLSSCQPVNPRVSTLWTNIPDIPGYVENFNASQTQWQILIRYKADPARELRTPGIKADLVISRNLDSRTFRSKWTSMSFLFERGGVAKSEFYPDLLNLGSDGGTPLLLPLSFDLPIVVFKKGSLPDPDGLYFSLNFLKDASQHFDDTTPIGFHRFKISHRWS
ncbi:MAG: hypothetical protein HKM06_06085, partial [Spirochaetales bacterium]|nr:hypothetical protein [Spirochaetales bacterium]